MWKGHVPQAPNFLTGGGWSSRSFFDYHTATHTFTHKAHTVLYLPFSVLPGILSNKHKLHGIWQYTMTKHFWAAFCALACNHNTVYNVFKAQLHYLYLPGLFDIKSIKIICGSFCLVQVSLKQPFIILPLPLSLSAPFIRFLSSALCNSRLLLFLSFSVHPPLHPFIPSEGQVLTASWHVVSPTVHDCAVALCLRGQGRPMQVHYINAIHTDWTQDWGPYMLMSGLAWPGSYAFNTGTDVKHRTWTLTPCISSAIHTAWSQPCHPMLPCLVGR